MGPPIANQGPIPKPKHGHPIFIFHNHESNHPPFLLRQYLPPSQAESIMTSMLNDIMRWRVPYCLGRFPTTNTFLRDGMSSSYGRSTVYNSLGLISRNTMGVTCQGCVSTVCACWMGKLMVAIINRIAYLPADSLWTWFPLHQGLPLLMHLLHYAHSKILQRKVHNSTAKLQWH